MFEDGTQQRGAREPDPGDTLVGGAPPALLDTLRSGWSFALDPEEPPHPRMGSADADVDLPALDDLVTQAGGWDHCAATDEQLLALVASAERARRVLDALTMHTLAELDVREVTDAECGMRTGAWLAHECDLPAGLANARVRLARKLRTQLPAVDAALADGVIAVEHARVLAEAATPRILDAFADCCAELIALVPTMRFDRWKSEVQRLAALLDQDGPHPGPDDLSQNTLRLHQDLADTQLLRGRMVGEMGLSVRHILNERADVIFRRMTQDEELTTDLRVPSRDTLMALALWELLREAHGSAVGRLPTTELALVVHADDATSVTDLAGNALSELDRDCLTCDPVFRPIVVNMVGEVIALGRSQHLVNRSQKRAMAHRDRGCVFPGCGNPISWTDAHHVEHWIRDGVTDLANLAALCRYHHGVVHRKGWRMYVSDDQWFWWITPSGDRFWSQRDGVQRQGPVPPGTGPPGEAHLE